MPRTRYFIILLLSVLLLTFQQLRAQAEAEKEGLVKDIKIYLLTSRILQPEDSLELARLIEEFLKKEEELPALKEIAYMITNKIVRDRANLQFLVFDLEKLAEDDYSTKIARIKKNNFKTALAWVEKLFKEMRKRRPEFNKSAQPLNQEDYKKIIKNNGSFLIDQRGYNIFKVFDGIEEKLEKAYSRWLEEYNKLLSELKSSGKEPEEIFSNQQIKFLKVFGRVYIYYNKLKGQILPSELERFKKQDDSA